MIVTLREGLLWLMGVGAGVLAFWVLERLETSVTPRLAGLRRWFIELTAEDKRYAAFGLTAVIAVLAYLLTLLMGYGLAPGAWRAWVEELFSVVAAAIVASQVAHGRVELRRRDEEAEYTYMGG
jgi:hypothetical protein